MSLWDSRSNLLVDLDVWRKVISSDRQAGPHPSFEAGLWWTLACYLKNIDYTIDSPDKKQYVLTFGTLKMLQCPQKVHQNTFPT